MRFYNYLTELGLRKKKTFQEKYSDIQKKIVELKKRKANAKDNKQAQKIDLTLKIYEEKLRLLQAQRNKQDSN